MSSWTASTPVRTVLRSLTRVPSLVLPSRAIIRRNRLPFSPHSNTWASTPPDSVGASILTSRRLIVISGPDAAKYLGGVTTSSFTKPCTSNPRTRGFYSAFLNAQGRILHDVFIYPNPDDNASSLGDTVNSFLLEVDATQVDQLIRHIRRYKFRAHFDLRLLDPAECTVWHAWGVAPGPVLIGTGANLETDYPASDELNPTSSPFTSLPSPGILTLIDPRAPGFGQRILVNGAFRGGTSHHRAILDLLEPRQRDESAYHMRRYLHGVAEGQTELVREHALPLESNMDLTGGIDFHKGCYMGQELTIRTRHRGVVRKRILPCVVYPVVDGPQEKVGGEGRIQYRERILEGAAETCPGVDIMPSMALDAGKQDGATQPARRARSAGKWLNGMGNVGLALCRLDVMTDVDLGEDERLAGLAVRTDQEFVMPTRVSGGGGEGPLVKVKAFVPEWIRAQIDWRLRVKPEDTPEAGEGE